MNFDFSEEQKLLQSTAKEFLEENSSLVHVREIFEADAGYSKELWKSVAELGWLGVAIPEEYGGAGFGYLESAKSVPIWPPSPSVRPSTSPPKRSSAPVMTPRRRST